MKEGRISRREVLKLARATGAAGVAGMPMLAVATETDSQLGTRQICDPRSDTPRPGSKRHNMADRR